MFKSYGLQKLTIRLAVATALVASCLLAPVPAGVLVQRTGEDYIAWEAEDYDGALTSADPNGWWTQVADADASGGQALNAVVQSGFDYNTPPGGGIANYLLQFAEEGTYRLYFRRKTADGDSMYRSPDFNLAPNDPPSRHITASSTYTWYEDIVAPAGRYLVEAGDIGSSLGFIIGSREPGFHVDRFVLSTNTGLSNAALDALFNWDVVITRATADGAWSTGDNWDNGAPTVDKPAYIGNDRSMTLSAASQGSSRAGDRPRRQSPARRRHADPNRRRPDRRRRPADRHQHDQRDRHDRYLHRHRRQVDRGLVGRSGRTRNRRQLGRQHGERLRHARPQRRKQLRCLSEQARHG